MPLLTVNGASAIPANPGRKALVLYVESGACAFGWGSPLNGTTNIGIPLPIGQMVAFCDEKHKTYAEAMQLFTSAATNVRYTEKF